MSASEPGASFFALTPDRVLDAVEVGGLRSTGRCLPLRAFENRVYEVELEDERRLVVIFFFKQKTAYEIGLGIPAEPLFRSIFIPKLRLILILNSFLGSSDSLVFSELFHSLAPRPLAARSISDFLLTYLAT